MVSEVWQKGIVIVLSLVIVGAIILPVQTEFIQIANPTQSVKINPVASDYTNHEPIIISSDDDFANQLWPGNGTASNPYLIEGLNICTNFTCISISNVSKQFMVNNCILGSFDKGTGVGISLSNSTSGNITFCTISGKEYGFQSNYSYNYELSDCTIFNNLKDGVKVLVLRYATFTNNSIHHNEDNGMNVDVAYSCIFEGNYVFNNSRDGIYIAYSKSSTIASNHIYNNNRTGLYLIGTINLIEWNWFYSNARENALDYGYFFITGQGWFNTWQFNYWDDYSGTSEKYAIPGGGATDIQPFQMEFTETTTSYLEPTTPDSIPFVMAGTIIGISFLIIAIVIIENLRKRPQT